MDKLMNEWMVEYTSPFYPPYFWAIIPDTRAEQSGNIRSRAALAAVFTKRYIQMSQNIWLQ